MIRARPYVVSGRSSIGTTRLTWDEYASRWATLHGGFDPRQATPLVQGWLRLAYGVGLALSRLRVPPSAITLMGVLLCVFVPLTAAGSPTGPFAAAVFVLLAAIADSVDGAIAVAANQSSRLGYVYDSLADRVGEAAWLVAFWLVGAPGVVVATAGGLSWLHEYLRARSVSAGMREIGAVTVGERPTRVAIAAVGLVLAGLAGLIDRGFVPGVITVATAVWVLVAAYGLVQLMAAVRRALR